MMQCLQGLVGITDSTCDCVIEGKTTEEIQALRASSSQLYMNKLPGGIDMDSVVDMGTCTTLLDTAKKARDQAIVDFENRLTDAVNAKYKGSKKKYTGLIGEMSYTDILPVLQNYQGTFLSPIEYTDGVLTLKQLQIVLNASVSTTVRIFRVLLGTVMGVEIGSWPVNTISNTYTPVNIGDAISLPFIYDNQAVEYYIGYDLTGLTAKPLNTNFTCQCPGRVYDWKQYITAQGFQTASMNMLNAKQVDSEYTRGLIFNVEIKCDSAKLFCREYDAFDGIAKTMATSLWYLAGYYFIEMILASSQLNQITTRDNHYYWGKRDHFYTESMSRIANYLAITIDITSSNCFVCKEVANQPYFSTILI